MASNPSRNQLTPPDDERDDALWDLLGQVPAAQAGPMFSRQVMRKIRLGSHASQPWWRRLFSPVALSTAAAACAVAIGLVVAFHGEPAATTVASQPDAASLVGIEGLVENDAVPADDDELVMTVADLTGDYSHMDALMLLGL